MSTGKGYITFVTTCKPFIAFCKASCEVTYLTIGICTALAGCFDRATSDI